MPSMIGSSGSVVLGTSNGPYKEPSMMSNASECRADGKDGYFARAIVSTSLPNPRMFLGAED
jgi:hypothetical protein